MIEGFWCEFGDSLGTLLAIHLQPSRTQEQMRKTEGRGEKLISFAQKEMSELNKNLRKKLDTDEDIEPHLWAAIEAALEESEVLAWGAIQLLDDLATTKEEIKANVSARPRLSYETFHGDINAFPTF